MSINVMSYGAYNDGTHPVETTNAFEQAIADAKLVSGGGDVVTGPAGYFAIDRPLDFRGGNGSCGLMLNGKYSSWLISYVTGQPTILWGGTTNKNTRFGGFGMRQGDGSMPGTHVEQQIAIHAPDGVGYGGIIEDVWIDGFPSHAIVINGDTGPTVIRDCTIQTCDGWGIVLTWGPQNVTIERGSIQMIRGGVIAVHCTALSIRDVDMELGDEATHAVIDFDGGTAGCTVSGGAASLRGNPDTGAVIRCAGFGNTFSGGINFAGSNAHNFLFDGPSCQRNIVQGGYYNGGNGAGYFAKVLGGVYNRFDTPFLTVSSYQAGHASVWDVSYPDNRSQCLNVPLVGTTMTNTLNPINVY